MKQATSEMFKDICNMIDIDYSDYELMEKFIDIQLVNKRNQISHGEYLDVDKELAYDIANKTIGLLQKFKNDLNTNYMTEKFLHLKTRP